ncbi:MAG: serine/threonine protein kinase [Bradymonadia bacterium]|jgi:serine/threonine protein kinase
MVDSVNGLPLKPGMTVAGRYTLISVLGEGGMAVVFEAHDKVIQRRIALKVLHKIEATARFEREARAASALHHPAVVKVFGIGTLPQGQPYMALEFIEGETLIEVINRVGPMRPVRALTLLMPVVGAMAEAHAAGIVHRDIKPSNLILQRAAGQFESLRLLDFGIALMQEASGERLTQAGEIFGTPEFMAPEQAMGMAVGPPADIWALGVVLYELLAAAPPFSGTHAPGILYKVVNEPMPPLPDNAPPELVDLIEACLAKNPAHRPASASVLLSKMEALLLRAAPSLISSQPVMPIAPPRFTHSTTMQPPRASRGWGWRWLLALTCFAALGSMGIWWAMLRPSSRPPLKSAVTRSQSKTPTVRAVGATLKDADEASGGGRAQDAGTTDSGAIDSGAPDASAPDASAPDASAPDASAPDADAAKVDEDAPPAALLAAAPSSVAAAPDLEQARAHLRAERPRKALAWLRAHRGVGDPTHRAQVEALARVGLNDMGRTATLLRRMTTRHPSAVDGDFLDAVIRALGTQTYWRSLVSPLADPRLRAHVEPRLLAVRQAGSSEAKRRARKVLDAIESRARRSSAKARPTPSAKARPTPSAKARPTPSAKARPAPSAKARPTRTIRRRPTRTARRRPTRIARQRPARNTPLRQTRRLIAQLRSASGCSARKRLIVALGKLGQTAALGPIKAERNAVGLSNVCMQGAIEDALEAISAAQR